MEPILKRKVGSILQALEDATCHNFSMKDMENEIADVLAPTTAGLPKRKEIITTKNDDAVNFGKDFSFVRKKQEYIPGLSIPQGESKPADKVLNFLSEWQPKHGQHQTPKYVSTDIRYRDAGFSRGNYHQHRSQNTQSAKKEKDTPFKSYDRISLNESFESRPGTSGLNEINERSGTENQERKPIDQGPFATHVPAGLNNDERQLDSREKFSRGGESNTRRYDNRDDRYNEGGRHYDNRGRGGESGRFFNNRGRGAEGRYYSRSVGRGGSDGDQRRFESRGGSAERRVGGFDGAFAHRERGHGRGNRPNRRMRRCKMTLEEQAETAARMQARDAEVERRLWMEAGVIPPDS